MINVLSLIVIIRYYIIWEMGRKVIGLNMKAQSLYSFLFMASTIEMVLEQKECFVLDSS